MKQFANNLPGKEWAIGFLKRRRELTERLSNNIKRKRAEVSLATIKEYFANLTPEIDGVPPENIWNYDETNLTDDPGNKRIITKRGSKHPERIINSTKSAISIMFCGNATGEILPPYTVYKAESMWTTWTEGGPLNARYNRSKSGWFDNVTFEDWFFQLVLPRLKMQAGKKVLIGDNLSSHINVAVLKKCEETQIAFIALPPNSTHLTQPLDIAYFRPMKVAWRKILGQWKETGNGRNAAGLSKDQFPRLLKCLMDRLSANGAGNLQSGFRKAGIYPTDAQQVLDCLPSSKSEHEANVSMSFIEHLESLRGAESNARKRKRKKINVTPGKSVSAADVSVTEVTSREDDEDSSDTDPEQEVDDRSSHEDMACNSRSTARNLKVNDYVIVEYEGELFPGIVCVKNSTGAEISVMQRSGVNWKWPKLNDQIFYDNLDIKMIINKPKEVSKRGAFSVPELSDRWL